MKRALALDARYIVRKMKKEKVPFLEHFREISRPALSVY